MEEDSCSNITVPVCVKKESQCCTQVISKVCESSTEVELRLKQPDQSCQDLEKEENEKINKLAEVIDLRNDIEESEEYEEYETCTDLENEEIEKMKKPSDIVDLREFEVTDGDYYDLRTGY